MGLARVAISLVAEDKKPCYPFTPGAKVRTANLPVIQCFLNPLVKWIFGSGGLVGGEIRNLVSGRLLPKARVL